MSGGGSKTQSVTTSSPELPENVKGAMGSSLGSAQNLFDSGSLYKPYTGSTVVPYSGNSQDGMSGTLTRANWWQPALDKSFGDVWDFTQGTGFNSPQNNAMDSLQGMISGPEGSQMRAYASGEYLDGSNNPYFSKVVDRAAESARNAVDMNAAGAGRYGSGTNQQILAREVGDLTNRAYSGQYNQEVQNMMGASGLRQSMVGDLFNAGQQGLDNKARATNMLDGAYNLALQPSQQRMAVGAMQEDLTARQMNDQLRIWQEQQQQPMKAAEWLSGMASGQGQLSGGQTQTIQTPKTSPFMAGLGGAATGFGVGGPMGAAIGGGAGLLGSLF